MRTFMREINIACLLVVMLMSSALAQGTSSYRYCVNIRVFGGAGNNSTDNTAPLNKALASLSGTGGCIYFPAGKYRFNSGVSYTMPAGIFSVTIVGDGQDATILTWPTVVAVGLAFKYTDVNATYGVVYNFVGSTFSAKSAGIIYGSYIQGVTVSQCNFTGGRYGIISLGGQTGVLAQLSVVNSQFGGLKGHAILSSTAIGETQISNSLFIVQNPNANAIFLQSNSHFTISNNHIAASTNNITNGIIIGPTASGAKGVITGNDIIGFTTCVWLQPGSANTAVVSNSLLTGCINPVIDNGVDNATSPNYN